MLILTLNTLAITYIFTSKTILSAIELEGNERSIAFKPLSNKALTILLKILSSVTSKEIF